MRSLIREAAILIILALAFILFIHDKVDEEGNYDPEHARERSIIPDFED